MLQGHLFCTLATHEQKYMKENSIIQKYVVEERRLNQNAGFITS